MSREHEGQNNNSEDLNFTSDWVPMRRGNGQIGSEHLYNRISWSGWTLDKWLLINPTALNATMEQAEIESQLEIRSFPNNKKADTPSANGSSGDVATMSKTRTANKEAKQSTFESYYDDVADKYVLLINSGAIADLTEKNVGNRSSEKFFKQYAKRLDKELKKGLNLILICDYLKKMDEDSEIIVEFASLLFSIGIIIGGNLVSIATSNPLSILQQELHMRSVIQDLLWRTGVSLLCLSLSKLLFTGVDVLLKRSEREDQGETIDQTLLAEVAEVYSEKNLAQIILPTILFNEVFQPMLSNHLKQNAYIKSK